MSAPLTVTVLSVQAGKVAPLGPNAVPSGFVKTPLTGPVAIGPLGLAGDEQADHRVHGGLDKAVYAYPSEHYPAWRAEFPEHDALWGPGAMGENLTLAGAVEADVAIGDVFAADSGLRLAITQPRQPCFKLAARFGDKRLPKAMVKTGRSGWYFRVLADGEIAAGMRLTRTERPQPDWALTRLSR